ncbi:sodium-translocating pyrophosphatase, partial [Methylobacterium sp. C33D]
TVVATMVLAAIFFSGAGGSNRDVLVPMMLYPLAIGSACILTSIAGTYAVRLGANQSIMGALYKGLTAAGVLSIAAIAAVNMTLLGGFSTSFTTSTGLTFTS